MPLFDAYTGPYKHKHRYWIGLMLIIRVIILIVFTVNQTNNPSVNLLAIAVIAITLLAYLSYIGGVYTNWLHNILEIVFLLNIGLLSGATFYLLFNDSTASAAIKISAGAAFITFSLIALYHCFQQLMSLKKIRDIKSNTGTNIVNIIRKRKEMSNILIKPRMNHDHSQVTHTSLELCEQLIQDQES